MYVCIVQVLVTFGFTVQVQNFAVLRHVAIRSHTDHKQLTCVAFEV